MPVQLINSILQLESLIVIIPVVAVSVFVLIRVILKRRKP